MGLLKEGSAQRCCKKPRSRPGKSNGICLGCWWFQTRETERCFHLEDLNRSQGDYGGFFFVVVVLFDFQVSVWSFEVMKTTQKAKIINTIRNSF